MLFLAPTIKTFVCIKYDWKACHALQIQVENVLMMISLEFGWNHLLPSHYFVKAFLCNALIDTFLAKKLETFTFISENFID